MKSITLDEAPEFQMNVSFYNLWEAFGLGEITEEELSDEIDKVIAGEDIWR